MNLEIFLSDKRVKYVCLVLSIVYSLSFLFWNVDLVDNFYWINRTNFYQQDFMNILSDAVCKIWLGVFGKSVLALRFLGWLFYASSMVLLYMCLLPKKEWVKNLHFLALGFVFMATGTQRMFTPDSPTVLCMALATIVLVRHYYTTKIYGCYLLAVIGALASAFRFPNILLFPITIFLAVVFDVCMKKYSVKNSIRYLLLSTLLFLFAYVSIVVVLSGRLDFLTFALDGVLHHKVGPSHNIGNLISMYKGTYFSQLANCASLFILFYLTKRLLRLVERKMLKMVLGFLIAIVIIFIQIKYSVLNAAGYGYFYGLLAILFTLFIEVKSSDVIFKVSCWSFILISLVGIAGSDCGIMKLMPYCAAITPFLMIRYKAISGGAKSLQYVCCGNNNGFLCLYQYDGYKKIFFDVG